MQTLTLQYYHEKRMPLATTKDISHIKTLISNYRRNFIKYYLTRGSTARPNNEQTLQGNTTNTNTMCPPRTHLHDEHTSIANNPSRSALHEQTSTLTAN